MSEKELVAKIRRLEIKLKDKGQEIDSLKFQIKEKSKEINRNKILVAGLESGELKSNLLRKVRSMDRYIQSVFKGDFEFKEKQR
jgi:hypothetical protein